MAFYNDRVKLADIDGREIYLIRKIKNKLKLNYYSYDGNNFEGDVADDALGEFDITINNGHVYLIYQDINRDIKLVILKGREREVHSLTRGSFPRVYELNIINHKDRINLLFLYPIDDSHMTFRIEHNLLLGNKWKNFFVDEIKIEKLLNPIKLVPYENKLYLGYYYKHQICIKSFNLEEDLWSESIVLTDNRDKLYLDLIYDEGLFHLAYSEYKEGNYVIKYKRFNGQNFIKEDEVEMSRKSNASTPTFIRKADKLWLCWNESFIIYSRYSKDFGRTWSHLQTWEEGRRQSIVRYKYATNNLKDMVLDHAFGTIYPDIKFIGFY